MKPPGKFKVLVDRPGLFLIIDEEGRMRQWYPPWSVQGAGFIPWVTAK